MLQDLVDAQRRVAAAEARRNAEWAAQEARNVAEAGHYAAVGYFVTRAERWSDKAARLEVLIGQPVGPQ